MTSSTRARSRSRVLTPPAIAAMALGTVVTTFALMALSYGGGQPASDNSLSVPLVIHLATVVPAIPLGAVVLWRRKGDASHRLLGRIWAMLMLTTAISAFWIGERINFLHLFSLVILVTIPVSLWRLKVGDIGGHRRAMEGAYIGLVIAGAFAFLPGRFLPALLYG